MITPGECVVAATAAYTVRVRMIHAHVRRALRDLEVWDQAAWGVPIPQPYMAFTLAEFGHIAIDAMHKLGVRFTDRELADIYHLWRYVGHVVGMDERLNPVSESDQVEELYRLTSPGPGEDDRDFVVALTDDYLIPELANALPGPQRIRHAAASTLMRSLQGVHRRRRGRRVAHSRRATQARRGSIGPLPGCRRACPAPWPGTLTG